MKKLKLFMLLTAFLLFTALVNSPKAYALEELDFIATKQEMGDVIHNGPTGVYYLIENLVDEYRANGVLFKFKDYNDETIEFIIQNGEIIYQKFSKNDYEINISSFGTDDISYTRLSNNYNKGFRIYFHEFNTTLGGETYTAYKDMISFNVSIIPDFEIYFIEYNESNFSLKTSQTDLEILTNNFQIITGSHLIYLDQENNVIEHTGIYQNQYDGQNRPIYFKDSEFQLNYHTTEPSELLLARNNITGNLKDFIAIDLTANQEINIDNYGNVTIDGQSLDIDFEPSNIMLSPKTIYDAFDTEFEHYHVTYLFKNSYGTRLNVREEFVGYRLILKEFVYSPGMGDPVPNNHVINIPDNYNLLTEDNNLSGYYKLKNEEILLNYSYSSGTHRYTIMFDGNSLDTLNLNSPSSSKTWNSFEILPDNFQIITSVRANNDDNPMPYHLVTSKTNWSDIVGDLTQFTSLDSELVDKDRQKYVFSLYDGQSKYYDSNVNILIDPNEDITTVNTVYRYIALKEESNVKIIIKEQQGNIRFAGTYNLFDYYGDTYTGYYTLEDLGLDYNNWVPNGYILFDAKYTDSRINHPGESTLTNNSYIFGDATITIYINQINTDITVTLMDFRFGSKYTLDIETKVGSTISLADFDAPEILRHRYLGLTYNSILSEEPIFYNPTDTFIKDTTLYLRYEYVNNLNISFETNGGVYLAPIELPVTTSNRRVAERLPVPAKSKAVFVGWFLDQELTIPAPLEISWTSYDDIRYYDVTFYASWVENATIVHFHTNQSSLEISSRVITKGEAINVSLPPKIDGYIFYGWFLDDKLTIEYDGLGLEDDVVNMYAKWVIDEDNPPADNNNQNQEPEEDDYNLFLTILVVAAVIGLVLIITRKKPKRRRR